MVSQQSARRSIRPESWDRFFVRTVRRIVFAEAVVRATGKSHRDVTSVQAAGAGRKFGESGFAIRHGYDLKDYVHGGCVNDWWGFTWMWSRRGGY
jgi:hypothetical protein